jgi:hypothetical protein
MAFKERYRRAAEVETRDMEIPLQTKCSEKDNDHRQPSAPISNLLIRFFRKEFGSNWEEQHKEYEEFWRDYFFTHTLN